MLEIVRWQKTKNHQPCVLFDGQNINCTWTVSVQSPPFSWLLCMAYGGGLSNGKQHKARFQEKYEDSIAVRGSVHRGIRVFAFVEGSSASKVHRCLLTRFSHGPRASQLGPCGQFLCKAEDMWVVVLSEKQNVFSFKQGN